MKFGYAVTGLIDPAHIYTNAAARPGDVLLLTKPIGTGVITTALKAGQGHESAWSQKRVRSMTHSPIAAAAEIAAAHPGVHSIPRHHRLRTYGPRPRNGPGQRRGAPNRSRRRSPLLPGALDAVRLGAIPGGLLANRDFASCVVADASPKASSSTTCGPCFTILKLPAACSSPSPPTTARRFSTRFTTMDCPPRRSAASSQRAPTPMAAPPSFCDDGDHQRRFPRDRYPHRIRQLGIKTISSAFCPGSMRFCRPRPSPPRSIPGPASGSLKASARARFPRQEIAAGAHSAASLHRGIGSTRGARGGRPRRAADLLAAPRHQRLRRPPAYQPGPRAPQ